MVNSFLKKSLIWLLSVFAFYGPSAQAQWNSSSDQTDWDQVRADASRLQALRNQQAAGAGVLNVLTSYPMDNHSQRQYMKIDTLSGEIAELERRMAPYGNPYAVQIEQAAEALKKERSIFPFISLYDIDRWLYMKDIPKPPGMDPLAHHMASSNNIAILRNLEQQLSKEFQTIGDEMAEIFSKTLDAGTKQRAGEQDWEFNDRKRSILRYFREWVLQIKDYELNPQDPRFLKRPPEGVDPLKFHVKQAAMVYFPWWVIRVDAEYPYKTHTFFQKLSTFFEYGLKVQSYIREEDRDRAQLLDHQQVLRTVAELDKYGKNLSKRNGTIAKILGRIIIQDLEGFVKRHRNLQKTFPSFRSRCEKVF